MHAIRLRAAWRSDPDGRRHERRFGRPTGLAAGARVWIAADADEAAAAGLVAASLGGHSIPLGASSPRVEVGALLAASNVLTLVTQRPAGALLASVRLEIEEPDALLDLGAVKP